MRFSTRSKVGILLSLVTIIALLSTLMVTILSRGAATHASSASTSQASQVQAFAVRSIKVPSSTTGTSNLVSPSSAKNLPARNVGVRTPGQSSHNSSTAPGVHSTSATSLDTTSGNLLHNFNGLSDLANASLNPFIAEPPDQGLCVGYLTDHANGQKIPVEFEMVNDVIAIYLTNGKFVVAANLELFFGEANFPGSPTAVVGDPRCHFDRQTHTFFFTATVIGQSTNLPPSSLSHIDLAAINANTQTGVELLIDTTDTGNSNCPCFADAPNFGIDNNAVYVSYNEFTLTQNPVFLDTLLFAFSKEQLVNQAHTVNGVVFPPLPVFGLQPAINVSFAGSEYLENSLVTNNVENTLVLRHVTNDAAITNGGLPTLNPPKIVRVENYAFPVLAASTGTGVTNSQGFTSAAFLNPDDDRIQQVEGIVDEGKIELWSALDTAISIPGDPQVRDGVAWFRIDAQSASVVEQNYVASAGNYLLYPAILHTSHGNTAIVFSVTSPTLNPSAAYTVSLSSPTNFASINIAAQGASPYITAFNRWGDYSAAALAQNGNDIWLGTEYVPVQTATTFYLNWGTEIFEVAGN